MVVLMVPLVLIGIFAVGSATGGNGGAPDPEVLIGMLGLMIGSLLVLYPLALFPFWMCGMDEEKRALYDRVCATRVVKKRISG